jgi:acyl carrier protein
VISTQPGSKGEFGVAGHPVLEQEIKELIIDALALEDVAPSDIETEAALFVEGLGLDSIDALELAMALEERYGVKIGDDPERNQQIFASVRNLATFVSENRVH